MPLGNISAVIDTLEFDTSDCYYPDVIHIAGDIFAVVYRGPNNTGLLRTFEITSNGQIGAATIDSFTFEDTYCFAPEILQVSGSVYVIAYSEIDQPGELAGRLHIQTVTINPDGTIDDAAIDTLVLDATLSRELDIIHVFGTIYAVCYPRLSWAHGQLTTVNIDNAGNIGAAAIDTLTFVAGQCVGPSIVLVAGDIYAISFRGTANDDLMVVTVDIDTDGQIAAAVTDSAIINDTVSSLAQTFPIIKISGTTYAVAYPEGTTTDGFLVTFTIADNGTIGDIIDTWEFEEDVSRRICIINIASDIYAIVYTGPARAGFPTELSGFIKTLRISSSGTIGEIVYVLEFATAEGQWPAVVSVTPEGVLAIAYQGSDGDGFVATLAISVTGNIHVAIGGKVRAGVNVFRNS